MDWKKYLQKSFLKTAKPSFKTSRCGADEAPGEGKRKKSRRNVVGRFGCNDQALFDAALGLSGFDEEFEAKVGVEPALFARTNTNTFLFTHPEPGLLCALTPEPRCCQCASLVFSRRETNVGFF